MRGLLIGEEGFDKFYSIKGLEVGHLFAQTNVFHRDFHLMRNTDDHTTFGGAVQFCDGQSGHFGRFDKLFGLFKSILSSAAVKYKQHLVRGVHIYLLHHLLYFGEFIHQTYLIVQTTSGVNDDDISVLCGGVSQGVVGHRQGLLPFSV